MLRLDQSNLNSVDLAGNNLSGVNLRFAQLIDADLHNAYLGVANLTFTNLASANLEGANLRDADLLFANLDGANLQGANFSDVRLRGADLSSANLKTAKNLTQYQINQAGMGDSATKLPGGLDKPKWWSSSNVIVTQPVKVPILRDSGFGASLVALKHVKELELGGEIGIPRKAGNSKKVDTTGALVYDVQPGSPADVAGFKAGDIIVAAVVKNPVRGLEDLKDTLGQHQDGRRVYFAIWRHYFPEGWRKGFLNGRLGD